MYETRDLEKATSPTASPLNGSPERAPKTVDLGIDGLSAAVHLGAGGSANVFAARRVDTGEEVAIKLLRASADSEKERVRFEREQETIGLLSTQDGIVPVLDAGLTDREEPYFLMPLMEGSLQDRIDNDGALDWQTATQLIAEVADTVDFAHSQKILHRDIKPGNILLDDGGVPRVADFGIAKLLDSSHSKSSKSLGTPSFMPPERFNGEEATAASDVYGLAATLSALITGSAPFLTGENDTDVSVMMRVVTEDPPSLAENDVPDDVRNAVTRAMAKDPDQRPQTAGEFAAILRSALDPHLDPALAGPVTVAIPRRNLTIPDGPITGGSGTGATTIELDDEDDDRRKWLLPLAAALFAAVVGIGALFALQGRGSESGELATGDETELDRSERDDAADDAGETGELSDDVDADGVQIDGTDNTDGSEGKITVEVEDGVETPDDGEDADGVATDGSTDGSADGSTGGESGTEGSTGGSEGDTGGTGGEVAGPTTTTTTTTAAPVKPVACFAASSSAVETGQSVSFTNCSTDASSYSWSFGDGTTSTNRNASKSWSTTGSKTVTLAVRGDGGTSTETFRVTVTEEPPPPVEPTACFNASDTSVETGHSVSFANCSSDADSYEWTFGDGTSSTQSSPSKSWSTPGSKTVRLTASGEGGTDSFTRTVTVTAPAVKPVACFHMSASTIDEGDSVSFTNCSTDATSYDWDFGAAGSSTHTNPTKTFSAHGSYTIRLTATGPGGSHSTTRSLTVNEVATTPDPRVKPSKIGCTTLGPAEWSWSWETLPAWVNDYRVEFNDGSTVSVGKQPASYRTTRVVSKIIAVDKNNIWSSTSVPACDPYDAGGPSAPSGVSCRFSNFRYQSDLWTWTETWSWTDDPDVASYQVVVEVNGSNQTYNSGRGSYVTDPSNGQPNSGWSVKKIIAIDADGKTATRNVSPCGNEGGSGWQNPT